MIENIGIGNKIGWPGRLKFPSVLFQIHIFFGSFSVLFLPSSLLLCTLPLIHFIFHYACDTTLFDSDSTIKLFQSIHQIAFPCSQQVPSTLPHLLLPLFGSGFLLCPFHWPILNEIERIESEFGLISQSLH